MEDAFSAAIRNYELLKPPNDKKKQPVDLTIDPTITMSNLAQSQGPLPDAPPRPKVRYS